MDLAAVLTQIDDILYTWLLIYLLAGSGIYFTIKLRFVQIRRFKDALHCMMEKKEGDKGVSSFQALMIATASRVGTGNMAGVATAIVLGGPGAAFWMWLMAILGAASAFVESTLAQIYKVPEEDGSLAICLDGKWFRTIDDFFQKGQIGGDRLPVLYYEMEGFEVIPDGSDR